MAARHLETGRAGEDAAAAFLRRAGYKIIERNFRQQSGELDIVCSQGGLLVFVEVKTRKEGSLALPGEALTRTKMTRLARAASLYLSRNDAWGRPCRFDLVTVVRVGSGLRVEHLEDAFDLSQIVDRGHSAWQPW